MQALREELDAANKKIDRYVNLVATLSEELDNLRRGICHNCKKKFVPSCSPVASSSDAHRSSLWRRIVGRGRIPSPSAVHSPVLQPQVDESFTTPSPDSNSLNKTKHAISAPPQASSATTPESSSTILDTVKPKQLGWIVTHNPDIKQAFQVDLVKTLNFTDAVYSVKFSPDGKYLAVGMTSGRTNVYDVERRLNICVLADYSQQDRWPIWNVEFSPDNRYLAAAGEDGQIMIWKLACKRMVSIFRLHHRAVYTTSFSPDGRFLFSGDAGGLIREWRIRDGSSKILQQTEYEICKSVNFSPNGRYIASVLWNGYLRLWDARTHHLLHEWMGHTKPIRCLAFTPDGNGLVSGGNEGTLKYWDVNSLVSSQSIRRPVTGGEFEEILRFEGHTQLICSVAISADNRWVVTCSYDQSVRIWDRYTATWQCTLQGHTDCVLGVDFSRAGKFIASGGEDGQISLWKYRNV